MADLARLLSGHDAKTPKESSSNPCPKRKHALNALRVGWMGDGTLYKLSLPEPVFLFLGRADERALSAGRPVAGIFEFLGDSQLLSGRVHARYNGHDGGQRRIADNRRHFLEVIDASSSPVSLFSCPFFGLCSPFFV